MATTGGSRPGQVNTQDWLNSLKHLVLVVVASILTPLAQGQPLDGAQLRQTAITSVATGLLTLLARWGQDNR